MAARRQAAAQPPSPPPSDDEEDDNQPQGALDAINQNLHVIQAVMVNMAQAVAAATAMGQAATQAANAAMAAAQQPQPNQPIPPVVNPVVPFIRSPLASQVGTVMDLNSKEGRKQYKDATVSLFPATEKFDIEPNKFQTFIDLLHLRTKTLGMLVQGANAMVPTAVGPPIDSIADYGRTTMAEVVAWETTFINTPTRNSQNSQMLFDLIVNSLSTQGFQRVSVWKDQFKINGFDSGGCLLKVVVRESYLDSSATETTIRTNLSNLDDYIRDNGSDLVAFNAYVQSQLDGLAARGRTTTELKVNLFKGYKAVKDDDFINYMKTIQNADEDGTSTIDAPLLMLKTVNFYKNKLTRNEWEKQSDSKREILALRAEVKSIKKTSGRSTKALSPSGPPKSGKLRTKTPKKVTSDVKRPEKPAWLRDHIKPKGEALKKGREWNSIMWYWCAEETNGKCGGKWRTHKPKDCKGLAHPPTDDKSKKKVKFTGKRKADALKIATANEALVADQAGSSDYESD